MECKNIIILNEHELQFPLISPLNTLDIDEGNFDKDFLRSKMLFCTLSFRAPFPKNLKIFKPFLRFP